MSNDNQGKFVEKMRDWACVREREENWCHLRLICMMNTFGRDVFGVILCISGILFFENLLLNLEDLHECFINS
jgi:hypothetical protein